ncbi:hypothetical protein AMJ86_04865 [bacterium SM23_57]|nr:MAG: hypothetical protein AMJ86_04865 [bacterium SM23_57]
MSVLFLALLGGCGAPEDEVVVARVGGRILTQERMRQEIPQSLADSLKELAAEEFVHRWVEEELLLLEAHHQHLEEDSWVDRAVEAYRRKVLISRLLDQEVLTDTLVTSSVIEDYYQDHQSEFIRSDEEVLMGYFVSEDRDGAHSARTAWVNGADFSEIMAGEINLWGEDSVVVSRGELGALEDKIFGMGVGAVTGEEPLGERWAVFKVYRRYPAGSVRDLPEVTNEVRARLIAIYRQEALARYLEGLRSRYPVEVNEDLLSGGSDTSQGGND